MGNWTRDELESAFADYQAAGAKAATSGDWATWADSVFTEDAHYVEHHFGEFHGRAAIRDWITGAMAAYPGNEMNAFPIEWYVIDEDRGWVICQIWNRMRDPGDGSVHQAYNITVLKYAGNGRWSYEEDVYNPIKFGETIVAWEAKRQQVAAP